MAGLAADEAEAGDDAGSRLEGLWDALEKWFADEEFRGSYVDNVATELRAEPGHPARPPSPPTGPPSASCCGDRRPGRRPLARGAALQLHMLLDGATAVAVVDRQPGAAASARTMARGRGGVSGPLGHPGYLAADDAPHERSRMQDLPAAAWRTSTLCDLNGCVEVSSSTARWPSATPRTAPGPSCCSPPASGQPSSAASATANRPPLTAAAGRGARPEAETCARPGHHPRRGGLMGRKRRDEDKLSEQNAEPADIAEGATTPRPSHASATAASWPSWPRWPAPPPTSCAATSARPSSTRASGTKPPPRPDHRPGRPGLQRPTA